MKSLKIVSYNLRNMWLGDGINSFLHRAGGILHKLDLEEPDLICFQEAAENIADFLERHLPEYLILYRGRYEKLDKEGLAVGIRKSTLELLSTDCFWLSPTPYTPGSRYPGQSDCPRECQVLLLRRRDNQEPFWVYNNHLDHMSDNARILGIRQVLARVQEDQEKFAFPVYIMGDFNASPDSDTIRECDSYREFPIVDLTKDLPGTFHDFGRRSTEGSHNHIDYIYVDTATAQLPHSVSLWTDEHNGIYLSDHYPICLEMFSSPASKTFSVSEAQEE